MSVISKRVHSEGVSLLPKKVPFRDSEPNRWSSQVLHFFLGNAFPKFWQQYSLFIWSILIWIIFFFFWKPKYLQKQKKSNKL